MRKLIASLGAILVCSFCFGQEVNWINVVKFVPKGYDTLDGGFVKGDLNKDGKEDVVLALYSKQEDIERSDAPDRILIVLLSTSKGLVKVGISKEILMCKVCGGIFGDPWEGVEIVKDILVIKHYGGSAWRWSDTQKFRYQNGRMYLIGSTYDSFWVNANCDDIGNGSRNYRDVNWVTGDEEMIKRDENCTLIEHTKKKIKVKPLQKLEQYNRN